MDKYINKIINVDCLDILKQLPDKSIDLILTDPPYGIDISKTGRVGGNNIAKTKNYGNKEWDNSIPSAELFSEIFRVSKNQIIFGGNYFVEYLKNSSCWIVWDKNNSGNFADCELAYTSFKTAVRKYKYTWNGMIQENMKHKEVRVHPTQKPLALFEWCLQNYSKEGDLVLDCFSGSGTTAVACHNLKRRFICIEKDVDYYKASVERLERVQEQLELF
jgi:site-specific DNA-methyltransferase (adenine-specific)